MTLNVFTQNLGDTNVAWPADADSQAELGAKVLDAVQVIVDILAERDVRYEVSFADLDTAYTDHSKRRVVVSAKPMTESGHTLKGVVDIIAGFAVHEVGHTDERERTFMETIGLEWPGKVTPHRLANILSDVRLEATKIERFRGLRDVFIPTMDWVSKETCPTWEITYGDSLHDRLNFAGQAIRYAPFVTFGQDATTQDQLRWWQDWGAVDHTTDNETMLRKVREAIAHIRDGAKGSEPQPQPGEGQPQPGEGKGQPNPGNPDNDFPDDDTEGGDEGGESGDTEGEGEGNPSGGDGDGEDGDTEGGDQGSGDSESDDDTEGEGKGKGTEGGEAGDDASDSTEGESGEDSEGDGNGQMDEGETLDRSKTDGPMNDGAGGSGKAVADADPEDVDDGLDESKLNKTQDEITHVDQTEAIQQQRLQQRVDEERTSTRLDAGAFGKLKVRVRL